MSSPSVAINGAFVGQRVTGQQRYAREMARELLRKDTVRLLAPPRTVRGRSASAWAWSQLTPMLRAPDEWLLSLSSRGPIYAQQHIVTVHDLFVLTNPEWYSGAYVRTHAPILSAQLKRAAGLVTVSPQTAQALRKFVGSSKKIVTAPNGVRLPILRSETSPIRGNYLLVVASKDPRKNLSRLAEAYGALSRRQRDLMPLWVVGGSNRTVFSDPGTQWPEGVRHLGYVTEAKLDRIYRSARAVVIPSLAEGFGLPLVESMARGTRVLVSDIPVFHWIAGDAATYFDPTSIDDLRSVLANEAELDPSLRLDEPVTQEVLKRFSWQASADSLLDALGSWSTVLSFG